MRQLTATEAARRFSELLNRVAGGDEIEITRGGHAVAVIAPPKAHVISADRFRAMMASAPVPDADFAEDLRALRAGLPAVKDPWPS